MHNLRLRESISDLDRIVRRETKVQAKDLSVVYRIAVQHFDIHQPVTQVVSIHKRDAWQRN
jgi:hypothetical protein